MVSISLDSFEQERAIMIKPKHSKSILMTGGDLVTKTEL
jgi:hypothetical protein